MSSDRFSEKTILFLQDLSKNNDKSWFEQNRSHYEELLLTPMKQLVLDLGPLMKDIDNKIDTNPRINNTISKIYRDTRFSHDKTPFRCDQWIIFKRPVRIFGNVPEFYLYFTPEEYHIGMGYYASTPENMESFRNSIDTSPGQFETIVSQFENQYEIDLFGEDYKRRIPNPHPLNFQQWYQKKSFYVSCVKEIDKSFYSPSLKNEAAKVFLFCSGLYKFLTGVDEK